MDASAAGETLGLSVDLLGVSYVEDRYQCTCALCGGRADAEYSGWFAVGARRFSLYLCEPCTIAALQVTFRRLAESLVEIGQAEAPVAVADDEEQPF